MGLCFKWVISGRSARRRPALRDRTRLRPATDRCSSNTATARTRPAPAVRARSSNTTRPEQVQHTYEIVGSVDGLKYNPYTDKVWALQNQDGNSTLSLIDPNTHKVSGPISFANASTTRGYDDVVFGRRQGVPELHEPVDGREPEQCANCRRADRRRESAWQGSAVNAGDRDNRLYRHQHRDRPNLGRAADRPGLVEDSAERRPPFSSGDGGVITEIHIPATNQSISFTPIQGVTAGSAGLDDVVKPNATSGTFTVADAKGDRFQSFHVSGLNVNYFYGSVGNAIRPDRSARPASSPRSSPAPMIRASDPLTVSASSQTRQPPASPALATCCTSWRTARRAPIGPSTARRLGSREVQSGARRQRRLRICRSDARVVVIDALASGVICEVDIDFTPLWRLCQSGGCVLRAQ